jgi:hypothetical protein
VHAFCSDHALRFHGDRAARIIIIPIEPPTCNLPTAAALEYAAASVSEMRGRWLHHLVM